MSELSVVFETSSTMRVLILFALLACASAAPSHLIPVALADESITAVGPGIAAPEVVGENEKADVKSAVDSEVKSEVVSEVKSEDNENVGVAAADYKSTEMKSESKKSDEEHLNELIERVKKFDLALQALRATYPTPVTDKP